MRKVPLKNYLILLFLSIVTIVVVIYLVNLYKTKEDYDAEINHRMTYLSEIKESDFENYITENQEGIIYLSNSKDTSIKSLEKKLNKTLKNKEYLNEIVYLNLKNISQDFKITISNNYTVNHNVPDIKNIPNVMIIKDGKISNTFYINSSTTSQEIIKFIENNYD